MKTHWVRLMGRVGVAAGSTLAVAFSLMTFPAALPHMTVLWAGCYVVALFVRGSAWPLPSALFIILVVKRTDLPVLVVVFLGVLAVVAILDLARFRRIRAARWETVLVTVIVVLSWSAMAIDRTLAAHTSRRTLLESGRPIACLGDSLTAWGWPADLRTRLSVPVLDFSSPGIDTSDGVARLPAILAQRPQIVVIELGGHDFLRGRSRAETKGNLARMIAQLRASRAEVILFEIPRGVITDGYSGMERELAREFDLELIPDTPLRQLVVWSRQGLPCRFPLSDDGIHPNAAGNAHLARTVEEAIRRITRSPPRP